MYRPASIRCGSLIWRKYRSVLAIVLWSLLGFVPIGGGLSAQRPIHQLPGIARPGIAWNVHGVWRAEGVRVSIRTGDPIIPGSLLQPGSEEAEHSITILLPDGQRIFYECFAVSDCARGFRVPRLYRNPEPFAVRMLAQIRAALAQQYGEPQPGSTPRIARDEVAAEMDANNSVEIGGLSVSLSNGDYSGDLRPLSPAGARQSSIPLRKNDDLFVLPLPRPGFYELVISDSMKRPRIDVLLAAVRRTHGSAQVANFHNAQKLMQEWDENNQGWPVHDFQRAYLRALMTGIKPITVQTATQAIVRRQGVTAEPQFTPRPGVFSGDTAVTLRCATPGAVIHYTFDNSEPFESSPVYHAPIMVKGTALTIKAFSESPGRKDSPVVTGIFRIGDG